MRVFGLICCLILLGATGALGSARLRSVSVADHGNDTLVHLSVDEGQARPNVHMLGEDRLIVDLPGIEPALPSHQVEAGTARLTRVRIGLHHEPALRTRVVFDLTGPTSYTVRFVDGGLDVLLRPLGAPNAAAPPVPTAPEPEPTHAIAFPEQAESPRPTSTPVSRRAEEPPPTPDATPSPRPSASPSPRPTASPTPRPTATPTPRPTAAPSPAPTVATVPGSHAAEVRADDEPLPDPDPAEPIPSGTVTIDFRDANVRTVIDLIANVGGYDVIFTPEVRGNVTVRIIEGPWEEALDTVLEMKRLRATRHADLILVSPDDWE